MVYAPLAVGGLDVLLNYLSWPNKNNHRLNNNSQYSRKIYLVASNMLFKYRSFSKTYAGKHKCILNSRQIFFKSV